MWRSCPGRSRVGGAGGEANLFKFVFVKYIISCAVDKMAADSVAVERSL